MGAINWSMRLREFYSLDFHSTTGVRPTHTRIVHFNGFDFLFKRDYQTNLELARTAWN